MRVESGVVVGTKAMAECGCADTAKIGEELGWWQSLPSCKSCLEGATRSKRRARHSGSQVWDHADACRLHSSTECTQPDRTAHLLSRFLLKGEYHLLVFLPTIVGLCRCLRRSYAIVIIVRCIAPWQRAVVTVGWSAPPFPLHTPTNALALAETCSRCW